jgi:methane monooxygenase component D
MNASARAVIVRAPFVREADMTQAIGDEQTLSGAEKEGSAASLLIHEEARYRAFAMDLDYMWRWEILRDGEFVQEGCSLSERAAREAVAHVIAHFRAQDVRRGAPGDRTDEIRELLKEIGTPQPIPAAD